MSGEPYDKNRPTNFSPKFGAGQSISAISGGSTSAAAALDATLTELYIVNEGPATAFVRWGVGAQTAALTDFPIPSGSAQVVRKDVADTVAAITEASTATVRIIPGFGQ